MACSKGLFIYPVIYHIYNINQWLRSENSLRKRPEMQRRAGVFVAVLGAAMPPVRCARTRRPADPAGTQSQPLTHPRNLSTIRQSVAVPRLKPARSRYHARPDRLPCNRPAATRPRPCSVGSRLASPRIRRRRPQPPPKGFFAFLWACSEGLRPYILGMTHLHGDDRRVRGAAVRDARAASSTGSRTWSRRSCGPRSAAACCCSRGILAASSLLVALQTMLKHQTLAANFPMRLRWNFHRLMLGQSMSFYQDEFAGRVAAKVMQTALAVRDTWFTVADILVFIIIYFVTMVSVVGSFDLWLLLPFVGWLALYGVALCVLRAAARQGRRGAGRRALVDDRPRDGRLHQHRDREAVLAREPRGRIRARRDARVHADRAGADAARERLRDRQPHAQHAAVGRDGRVCAVAVDAGAASASAPWRPQRRWRCG